MPKHPEEQGDVQTRSKVEKPRRFKVLLHNDDYTTMEFVVMILRQVFHLSPAAASRVMLHVHRKGVGVAGVYPRDIAETRADQVLGLAREAGYPLQCTLEQE
ncbi:MAG: ATP-dependent Clp protease adapter ClpS [Deltaproteobacteria bacterium]|nr:ATP-dependent Clp protease adapter ClpS [Deltaproteobacteria bacterium]